MKMPQIEARARPDAETALQKLHGLAVLSTFVGNFGQMSEGFGIVRVQNTARVDCALLGLAKVFEGVRKRIGPEKHLAMVEQHAHIFGSQRSRFTYGNTVGNV
jgi:hypothetical protein